MLKYAFRCSPLARPHPFLPDHDLATVIHAFVSSRLDYSNLQCLGLKVEVIQRLHPASSVPLLIPTLLLLLNQGLSPGLQNHQ